jgi:hypothetical protein
MPDALLGALLMIPFPVSLMGIIFLNRRPLQWLLRYRAWFEGVGLSQRALQNALFVGADTVFAVLLLMGVQYFGVHAYTLVDVPKAGDLLGRDSFSTVDVCLDVRLAAPIQKARTSRGLAALGRTREANEAVSD